jgi:hypothetical protein
MHKGRKFSRDLDRLGAASALYAAQEAQRANLGDDHDYDDARNDVHQVVVQVLDTIEKNLDEDLLERLDRGEYPHVASAWDYWPRPSSWRSMWPHHGYAYPAAFSTLRFNRTRSSDMLDQILEDFRTDFETRLKNARREDRSLSETELDDALQELRQDLQGVARRTRRREERHAEEEGARVSRQTKRRETKEA